MRFVTPAALLLLPVLLALVWSSVKRARAHRSTIGYSDLQLLKWSSAARPLWESHLPKSLLAAAMVLGILALARPQYGITRTTIPTSGVDIILALDTSLSMKANDLRPNRLVAAREVSKAFVKSRPEDRIGLVVYGGTSVTQCPLTADHQALEWLLGQVELGSTGVDGTAIGEALATSVNRLKDSDAKSKVVVLLTDGRSNVGQIDPLVAAELASQLGIKVYTIGVGRAQPAPFAWPPVRGGELDEQTLSQIAEVTGGRYFRADDNSSLAGIYSEIDRLEKTKLPAKTSVEYKELYLWLLMAALGLGLAGVVLQGTIFKEAP